MTSRTVIGNKVTFATATANDNFPKVVFTDATTMEIAADAVEFSLITADDADVTYEADTTPFVTVSEADYPLTVGEDYDTCIMTTYANRNIVVKKLVGVPVLTLTLSTDNPNLSWTNTFGLKTSIYRTELYDDGTTAPSEYTLVAEIDSPATPGTPATYLDEAIDVVADGATEKAISYFVVNEKGVSDVKEVSSAA